MRLRGLQSLPVAKCEAHGFPGLNGGGFQVFRAGVSKLWDASPTPTSKWKPQSTNPQTHNHKGKTVLGIHIKCFAPDGCGPLSLRAFNFPIWGDGCLDSEAGSYVPKSPIPPPIFSICGHVRGLLMQAELAMASSSIALFFVLLFFLSTSSTLTLLAPQRIVAF